MIIEDKLKVYSIYFNTLNMKYEVETTYVNNSSPDTQYNELCQLLDATGYDVVDYNNDIAMVVDDNGFFKHSYPVFEVLCEDGTSVKLVGKILFVRNQYNEYSVDFTSIKAEDIFKLRISLNIKLLGMTK